ncbi:MAG: hypothetical protein ACRCRV_06225 [Cetobacterium sp.]
MKKIFKYFVLLSLFSSLIYGNEDITMERLEELYKNKMISIEDYEFLKDELEGKLQEKHYYSLYLNRTWVDDKFPLIIIGEKNYIPLFYFFKEINFKNYTYKDQHIEMFLGRVLDRVTINFKNGKISGIEKTNIEPEDFYIDGDEIFLTSKIFSDIFLNAIDINHKNTKISMSTKYSTPQEIRQGLKSTEEKLESRNLRNDFYYTNSQKLFDLGYMRFNFDKTFEKKDADWTGLLEYQGPLLYGNLTTTYDVKEKEFTSTSLYYPNLPHNHFMELSMNRVGSDEDSYWEKSILFEKDKGYFEEGKKFIIRENVPIGSRVELVYLGATIDIQNESSGFVEFKNDEIRNDREYTLRIHTKDGQIITRIIKTSDDFNQQNPGEFQYRLYSREDKISNKNIFETEIFYGITDHFTLGGKYYKTPELYDDNYLYLERAGAEIVYSNHIKTYPYTFVLSNEKVLNKNIFEETDTTQGLLQIKFDKTKFRYEKGIFSEFYENHKTDLFLIEYNPFDFLRLDYTYERLENFQKEKVKGYSLEAEVDYTFNRILTTFNFKKDIYDEKNYSLNFYYTGYRDYSIRWSNSISEKGNDFESTISLYNRTTKNGLDYGLDLSYSQETKEKITFRFTLDYDNWFNFNFETKENDNYKMSAGINRIVDLKNIRKPLDSMDTSRVKVVTFLDANNNNVYDKNEERIGNVEVEINNEKQITKLNEDTYFYGVPNDILYSFTPKVQLPGYDIVNSTFSLKGKKGGDILVNIPIKPLFTTSGNLQVPNLSEDEASDFYDGIVVRIKDSHGETLNATLPDQFGYYDLSGLNTGEYILEIISFKDTKILGLTIPLKLKYTDRKSKNITIDTQMINNKITLYSKEERKDD